MLAHRSFDCIPLTLCAVDSHWIEPHHWFYKLYCTLNGLHKLFSFFLLGPLIFVHLNKIPWNRPFLRWQHVTAPFVLCRNVLFHNYFTTYLKEPAVFFYDDWSEHARIAYHSRKHTVAQTNLAPRVSLPEERPWEGGWAQTWPRFHFWVIHV